MTKRSRRKEEALAALKARERQRNLRYLGITVLSLVIFGGLIWITNRPKPVEEDLLADAVGKAWGPADAPVQIQEWSDFNCSHCGELATGAAHEILETYGGTGKVHFEFMNFAFLADSSTIAAEAAMCATDQERFWDYYDTLFTHQGQFSPDELKGFAGDLGLDTAAFNQCLDDETYKQFVQDELEIGREAGVSSTPTMIINGNLIVGAKPFEEYQAVIEKELAGG